MNEFSEKVILFGIKEFLSGNEDKILACLPVLRFGDKYALVQNPNWKMQENEGFYFTNDLDLLENYITILELKQILDVFPGQLVILVGNKLTKIFRIYEIHKNIQRFPKIFEIQNGFGIFLSDQIFYENFKHMLFEYSKNLFDEELNIFSGTLISETANNAYMLLKGNSSTPKDELYVRVLAKAQIEKDSDTFRNYIEFAIRRLNKPRELIEKWVADYLKDRLTITYSQSEPTIFDKNLIYEYDQLSIPKKLEVSSNLSKEKLIENAYRSIDFIYLMNKNDLNGNFEKRWHAKADSFLKKDKNFRITLAHFLKARTNKLAKEEWAQDDIDFYELFDGFKNIKAIAYQINEYAKKMDMVNIIYGESQFPESRIFGKICESVFNKLRNAISIKRENLDYGTIQTTDGTEADLTLINELALSSTEKHRSIPIFSHSGYFVFITKKQLVKFFNECSFDIIKVTCEKILNYNSNNEIFDDDELCARCWLALKSGLKSYSFEEYKQLIIAIENHAKSIEKIKLEDFPARGKNFDNDFENFISGESNIFLGGSNHSRQLLKWWNHNLEEFYILLGPNHFNSLLKNTIPWPPRNRLVFSSNIRLNKSGAKKVLIENINRLFYEISNILYQIAYESDQNPHSESNDFIKYLMHELSKNLTKEKNFNDPWRWSFVADEWSMHHLLLKDNNFNLSWSSK
ncbi:hypothetical protein ACFL4T_01465 [candidate division KSB1 bacterium]